MGWDAEVWQTHRRTDRREGWNSYLDYILIHFEMTQIQSFSHLKVFYGNTKLLPRPLAALSKLRKVWNFKIWNYNFGGELLITCDFFEEWNKITHQTISLWTGVLLGVIFDIHIGSSGLMQILWVSERTLSNTPILKPLVFQIFWEILFHSSKKSHARF